jgi:hypothetical protein
MLLISWQRDIPVLLRTPGHLDVYGNLVFYWEGQERRRINLEIGQRETGSEREGHDFRGCGRTIPVSLIDLVPGEQTAHAVRTPVLNS